jgi:hypothetical protein
MNGTDPLFQDVEKFDVVYDKTFHDYVEKEALEILVLDDSRALEVEMRQDENKNNLVSLVDQGEFDDLIGTAKIPLHQLLVNDLIQNSFTLFNKKGQNAGEIVLNIFWEKVEIEPSSGAKASSVLIPYETKAWEETLILKLAEMLKYKGFNVNSAFGIFDKDCNDTITLLNFKDIVLFTLKFTNSQEELERLTHVVFNGKNFINKLDFYRVFSPLLPTNSAEANSNNVFLSDALNKSNQSLNSSVNAYNASMRIQKNNNENQVVESVSINLVPNSNNFYNTNKNLSNNFQDLNMSGTNNFNNMSMNSTTKDNFNNMNTNNNKFGFGSSNNVNNINNNNNNNNNYTTGSNFNTNSNFKTSSPRNDFDNGNKNKSLFEIVAKINEYMHKTSKNTIVEIYKMFDKDANSLVDKNVNIIFSTFYCLFFVKINFFIINRNLLVDFLS